MDLRSSKFIRFVSVHLTHEYATTQIRKTRMWKKRTQRVQLSLFDWTSALITVYIIKNTWTNNVLCRIKEITNVKDKKKWIQNPPPFDIPLHFKVERNGSNRILAGKILQIFCTRFFFPHFNVVQWVSFQDQIFFLLTRKKKKKIHQRDSRDLGRFNFHFILAVGGVSKCISKFHLGQKQKSGIRNLHSGSTTWK